MMGTAIAMTMTFPARPGSDKESSGEPATKEGSDAGEERQPERTQR